LFTEVAGVDAVDDLCQGQTLSHSEVVKKEAAGLSSGHNEGLVLVFTRPDGQASLRKWKNSAEGAEARKKEVLRLGTCHDVCAGLVAKGKLDARILDMLATMREVASANTSPAKKGRSKIKY
jgi:hypothetical protein